MKLKLALTFSIFILSTNNVIDTLKLRRE